MYNHVHNVQNGLIQDKCSCRTSIMKRDILMFLLAIRDVKTGIAAITLNDTSHYFVPKRKSFIY